MPFDFVCLGLVVIYMLFFVKSKTSEKFFFILPLVLLMASYFVGEMTFMSFSVNILSLMAVVVMACFYLSKLSTKYKRIVLFAVVFNIVVYVILVLINPYFLIQFNWLPVFVCTLLLGLFALNKVFCVLSYLSLSTLSIEIFSCIATLKTFDFYSFFDENFYKFFVILYVIFVVLCNLVKMAKFKRKTKTNIVLCKEEVGWLWN